MTRLLSLVGILVFLSSSESLAQPPASDNFNRYILRAVDFLAQNRAGLGYGMSAFTADLKFGDNGTLKAGNGTPRTMCVAAQLEVLVQALNMYANETGDNSPFHFIPKVSWERLRPLDLRGQIWIVSNSPARSAADAFANYGMGARVAFNALTSGSFVNFNRTNRTGHAAIFLAYLDANGNDLPRYSDAVAGFRYFSSQGRDSPDGGLGFRWAFFSDIGCPTLTGNRKRDCGMIRSESGNLLVSGIVRNPRSWDQKKAAEQVLQLRQTADPRFLREGEFDFNFFNGLTTDD